MAFGFSAEAKGGKTDVDVGTIYWDDIRRLLGLDEEFNRINRMGAFGGWEYDPETKTQRFVTTDPGMQAAQDRMSRRLGGEGFAPYTPPSQVSALTDAIMASRMGAMGLVDPEQDLGLKQESFGERFADRSGGGYQQAVNPYTSPPPPPVGGFQPPEGAPPPTATQPGTGAPPQANPYQGLPADYYNKSGRARKRYRKTLYDPNPATGVPDDLLNRQGNVRRKYRGVYDIPPPPVSQMSAPTGQMPVRNRMGMEY